MIGSAVAFPRFVAHDLRLSARGLASMFGSLSPRGLGVLIALLFVALHAAAWPIAGWLINIEDGPDGVARITAILASGVALTLPWIVGQSITEFTRTLFGRSDLELILSSPADAHSLLAARALSIAIGAVVSVGLLLAPLADVAALRGHPHWLALYPALLAAGLTGTGLAVVLAMGLFLTVGPRRARLLSQIAATVVGASAVLGAQVVAMLPEGMRASILAAFAPPANSVSSGQSLLWTPVRAAAGDPQAALIWAAFGALVFALACVLFGERFARAAVASSGAPANAGSSARGRVALWRKRQRGLARQGTTRRLARSLADVAASFAGRLHHAARRHSLARRRADGHNRGCIHAGPGRDCGATRRRLVLDRSFGRGRAGFSHDRSCLAARHRTRQNRRHRPADCAHPLFPPCRIGLRFALGGILRPSIWRRGDRLGRASQSLAASAVSSRPRASPSFPVETRRHDGAPGLDPVGGGDGRRSDRLVGDDRSSRRRGWGLSAQLEVGGDDCACAGLTPRALRRHSRACRARTAWV